jgi:DHA2 family multidrug resistance protein
MNSGEMTRSAAGNHNRWVVAVIVSMATFMEVLDTSIANVSLPHIAGGLAASLEESTWVLTSYLVSNAIILPISGWLSLVVGRKRFYMICVALFGISSLLCGLAPSLGWLIFFRILQGLGGGGLAPSEQSILADTFPPEQRGQAFALYGVAVVVAPALGPTLGGWITDNYSWHWIFFINIPVCILSLVLSYIILVDPPAVKEDRAKAVHGGLRVDYLGIILVALGLGCLQVVLDKGEIDDWMHSDFILSLTIISGMALAFLAWWELTQKDPIVDLPLLKNGNFALCMMAMFTTGFVLLSTTQLLPQFLQSVEGYDATKAGLALTAGGFATLFFMPVVGVLLKHVQPKFLIALGLLIEALACWHLSGFTTTVSFSHAAWARVLQGMGLPFLFVPINMISYAGLPAGKTNNASALINSMRNLGGSFGISFGATLLSRRGQFHHARLVESLTPFSRGHHLHPAPLATLQGAVEQQAAMLSYLDVFWVLTVLCFAVIPLALMLRRLQPGTAPAGH